MNEELVAEVQMSLVRVCRVARNAHAVWRELERQFPDLTPQDIKEACKPVIKRMVEAL